MTTFITIEDIKSITSISDNVDVELLSPHLSIAQDMYITPVLGDALSEGLQKQIEEGNVSGDTEVLLQKYVTPALAYYTWFSASPFMAYKHQRSGVVKQTSDNSESVDMEEFAYLTRRIENTAIHYTTLLYDYLEANKDKHPLYRTDARPRSKTRGIYTGFRK